MQSRPVQELDVLCIHMKILRQQRFDFGGFENILTEVIQFHDAAILVSAATLAGSKQKPCVILRTHGVRLIDEALEYCEPTHKYRGLNVHYFSAVFAVIKRIFFIACLSLFATSIGSQNPEEDLFASTDKVRAAAESVNAPLLSPTSWSLAIKEYKSAERDRANDRSANQIKQRLEKADQFFQQASANAEKASGIFQPAIEARQAAEAARAPRFGQRDWDQGEKRLDEAARAFEDENLYVARESAAIAESEFLLAELNAIKTRNLSTARSVIAEAKQRRAKKLAPRSLARAQRLLREADAALNEDRYETEIPKSLADQATREARHAIYITKVATGVRSGAVSVEDLILKWESALTEIALATGFEPDLTDGYSKTTQQISRSLRKMQSLPDEIAERNRQIESLEEELLELDAQLGGASEERLSLVRRLEEQARIREQFNYVGELFTLDEAKVLRDGDDILIRLVGLSFASNSAELGPEAPGLMNKVKTAIDQFPNCDITIEGHTDSSGNAEKNLLLSENRAQAVVTYMTETMRIPDHRVKAIGYGDVRPITSNKTQEGRAGNRRIDLIIAPKPAGL
jgi:OOP family OmpA-OmpF porin